VRIYSGARSVHAGEEGVRRLAVCCAPVVAYSGLVDSV
jgi:hypothetical protein